MTEIEQRQRTFWLQYCPSRFPRWRGISGRHGKIARWLHEKVWRCWGEELWTMCCTPLHSRLALNLWEIIRRAWNYPTMQLWYMKSWLDNSQWRSSSGTNRWICRGKLKAFLCCSCLPARRNLLERRETILYIFGILPRFEMVEVTETKLSGIMGEVNRIHVLPIQLKTAINSHCPFVHRPQMVINFRRKNSRIWKNLPNKTKI